MFNIEIPNFIIIIPEIYIFTVSIAILLFSLFIKRSNYNEEITYFNRLTFLLILILFLSLLLINSIGVLYLKSFSNLVITDSISYLFKMLVIFIMIIILGVSNKYLVEKGVYQYEYIVLTIFILLGIMIVISSYDFILFYAGLELTSICSYILLAIKREDVKSHEAGMKYLLLSGLGSGFLLYGISLIYGYTGSTNFTNITTFLMRNPYEETNLLFLLGLIMIIVAFAFKLSLAPFHMWTPDVYEGSLSPITLMLMTIFKISIIVILIRLLWFVFISLSKEWSQIIILLSVTSMIFGFIGGVLQSNLKRILAYSSISNMGFLLLGFLNPTNEGFSNIYIYLICYMVSNLGVIGVLMQIKANGNFIEKIDDLSGLHNKQPFLSFLLATFLFSMAGIPPMGGFFGKINIFLSLLSKGYIYLAIFAGLLSVVGVYYYLRIIKNIYVNDSQIAFSVKNKSFSLTNIILVFCFMIIFFFMFIIDKINLAITKIGVF